MAGNGKRGRPKKEVPQEEVVEEVNESVDEVKTEITEADIKRAIYESEQKKLEYDAQLAEIRRERNRSVLENITCGKCGNILSIPVDEYLKRGNFAVESVCEKCDSVNRVEITFDGDPTNSDVVINTVVKGPDYLLYPITLLNPEQLKKRIAFEAEEIEAGRHKSDQRLQLVIRAINEFIK
jgi:RNase P subunit RPR2